MNNINVRFLKFCKKCKKHKRRKDFSKKHALCKECRAQTTREKYNWTPKKKEYERKKRLVDPVYRIKKNLRRRLNIALHDKTKNGSAVRDMGCTGEELRIYLESLFKPGMDWNNYGISWQIDHKIPLGLYDLTNREQLLKACHYTNLQPLWKDEHSAKTVLDTKNIKDNKINKLNNDNKTYTNL